MSIPLDRLYHYIENLAQHVYENDVIIYRFYPDGSKKPEDIIPLTPKFSTFTWKQKMLQPEIFCNDQEPLDFERYNNFDLASTSHIYRLILEKNYELKLVNFRKLRNIWDRALLLHSEQRSKQLEIYQSSQFIPVYYWSHGLIAIDWFRFAKHVEQQKRSNKTFLIYNRAWSGTREYRLKFIDLLIDRGLQDHCQTTLNAIDPESKIHYSKHNFTNPNFVPSNEVEKFFQRTTSPGNCSADFVLEDYEQTDIEIVLETLFDDDRWHLTEKILRPIACSQPFVLASTMGSLEYLRGYGFKTFDSVWSEDYDLIQDPVKRLQAIVDLMTTISQWDTETRNNKMKLAQDIANYNKTYFFSEIFFNRVMNELKSNLTEGFQQLQNTNTSQDWLEHRAMCLSDPDISKLIVSQRSDEVATEVLEIATMYNQRNSSK